MFLANSVALWFLALIPVVAFAYLIKRKLRERRVAAMFLWEDVLEQTVSTSKNFRVRNFLALILALAITTALIGALVEPTSRNAAKTAALIVALDNSRSMNAVEKNGKTRFQLAKEFVRKTIANKGFDTQVLILTTSAPSRIACGFTSDVAVLNDRLDGISATDSPCDMTRCLETARFFQKTRAGKTRTLVVSDGCFEDAETVVASFVSDGASLKKIGGALDNVGIVAFETRRGAGGDGVFETTLEVANFSEVATNVEVELELDGALIDVVPFQLAVNERVRRFLKNESNLGGELTARLVLTENAPNALANDDVARRNLQNFPELNVLLFGDCDKFTNAVFASLQNVNLREITEIPATLADDELLVVCGAAPNALPQGKILLVSPTNGGDYFSVGDNTGEAFAELETLEGAATRFLNFDDVPLQDVRNIEFMDNVKPTVWAKTLDGAPLIFSIENDNTSLWTFNFSTSEGALPLRALFPILVANVVGVVRGENSETPNVFSLDASAESNLKSSVKFSEAKAYVESANGLAAVPIWRAAAMLALMLALLEFYWYCRRKID